MRTARHLLVAPLAIAGLLFSGACGGSDDDPADSTEAVDDAGGTDRDDGSDDGGSGDDDSSATDAVDGGSSGSAGSEIQMGEAVWSRVWAHVEITGDVSASIDVESTDGLSTAGLTNVVFNGDDGSQVIFSLLDEDGSGAISVTTQEISTAGDWRSGCDLSVLEQDADRVHLYFQCDEIAAVSLDTAEDYTIGLQGDIQFEA